jgi:hypothetical protein
MTGKLADTERKWFEQHLADCARCREDVAEWSRIWHRLSEQPPRPEAPPALRNDTFPPDSRHTDRFGNTLSGPLSGQPGNGQAGGRMLHEPEDLRMRQPLRWLIVAILLAMAFGTGYWAKTVMLVLAEPHQPDKNGESLRIEQWIRLVPTDRHGLSEPVDQRYGLMGLLQLPTERLLVVYATGLPPVHGEGAYHVWLSMDGHVYRVGVFTTDAAGVGILTVPWPSHEQTFDQVDITLETEKKCRQTAGAQNFQFRVSVHGPVVMI